MRGEKLSDWEDDGSLKFEERRMLEKKSLGLKVREKVPLWKKGERVGRIFD